MKSSTIKILLVGDYSIFRTALRMFLETEKRIRVAGEASEMEKAAEIIAIDKPDLILVDLPDYGGKDVLTFLTGAKVPVIILVGQHDVGIYQKCLKLGFRGLVQKEASSETLFKAIEKVHQGEIWFDRTIMGDTIRQLLDEKQSLHDNPKAHIANSLTVREKEVVDLICQGMKNKMIADHLFITETTVRHHLTSVFNKFEISSRLELVVYAFKNNLVTTSEKNGTHNRNGYSEDLRGSFAS
jgi:DNA-binding NarL/FixJ family response regulator